MYIDDGKALCRRWEESVKVLGNKINPACDFIIHGMQMGPWPWHATGFVPMIKIDHNFRPDIMQYFECYTMAA